MIKVIKFGSTWCVPCKRLNPILNQIKSEYPSVIFEDVDVDNDSKRAIEYNIRGVPTLIFEKNGEVVKRTMGVTTKQNISNILNSL